MHIDVARLPALASERLALEPLSAAHAPEMFGPLQEPSLYTYTSDGPPDSLQALLERYRRLEGRLSPDRTELWLNWAARSAEAAIGYVQATVRRDRTATIAYVIFPAFQRRGFGKEAVRALLEYLRGAGVLTAQAVVDQRNAASRNLMRALQFSEGETIDNPADASLDVVYRKRLGTL